MGPGGSTSKSSCFSFIEALAPFLFFFFSFEFILSVSELKLACYCPMYLCVRAYRSSEDVRYIGKVSLDVS